VCAWALGRSTSGKRAAWYVGFLAHGAAEGQRDAIRCKMEKGAQAGVPVVPKSETPARLLAFGAVRGITENDNTRGIIYCQGRLSPALARGGRRLCLMDS
jgi:hypothetical protein